MGTKWIKGQSEHLKLHPDIRAVLFSLKSDSEMPYLFGMKLRVMRFIYKLGSRGSFLELHTAREKVHFA